MRIYYKVIDEQDEFAEMYDAEQFAEAVAMYLFKVDDGSGYWTKNGKMSDDEVFSTDREDATHVVWYGK